MYVYALIAISIIAFILACCAVCGCIAYPKNSIPTRVVDDGITRVVVPLKFPLIDYANRLSEGGKPDTWFGPITQPANTYIKTISLTPDRDIVGTQLGFLMGTTTKAIEIIKDNAIFDALQSQWLKGCTITLVSNGIPVTANALLGLGINNKAITFEDNNAKTTTSREIISGIQSGAALVSGNGAAITMVIEFSTSPILPTMFSSIDSVKEPKERKAHLL